MSRRSTRQKAAATRNRRSSIAIWPHRERGSGKYSLRPRGLHSVSEMNSPARRALPFVSFGGIANASSLGKFYAMLANGGEIDGRRFFTAETIHSMTTTLVSGMDRVFQIPTAFSAGFMKDPPETERRSSVRHCLPSDTPAPAAATLLPILRIIFRLPTS